MVDKEDEEDIAEKVDEIINEQINNSSPSRPEERIDVILEELEEYWKESPDLRLGQIIGGIGQQNGFGKDPFYMEDDVVLRELEDRNSD
jgi:hydrogenase maturation factor HypE